MKRINPVVAAGAVILIALVVFVVIRSTRKPAPAPVDATSTQAAMGVSSATPVTTPADTVAQPSSSTPATLPPMASPRGMAAPPVTTAPILQEREPTKEEVAHIPRIAPEELLEAYNAKSVTIIDVRDVDSYKERHIPGALHIPLAYIQGEIPYLPKDKPIVTYCT